MNRVPRVVCIDVLYVKDPRVAFERSERLHGFGMRISVANARKLQRKDPRVVRLGVLHGLE